MKRAFFLMFMALSLISHANTAGAHSESDEAISEESPAQYVDGLTYSGSSEDEEARFQEASWVRPDFCRHSKMAPLPRRCFRPKAEVAEE